MEHCPNQKTIDQIEKLVIKGNGEPSLVTHIAKMSSKLDTYMERQEDLIKEFGITNKEFYNFKSAAEATVIEQDKQKVRSRWGMGIMVTVLLSLLTVLSAWIRGEQKTLESRQNYDSYDLMMIMDSLNIGFKTRGQDSLNIEL